jgi:hypothetical protein
MTRHALDHLLRVGGAWQRILPGVYLTVTGTPTVEQREVAALLYAGSASVMTGPAALRRHRIRVVAAIRGALKAGRARPPLHIRAVPAAA